MNLSKSTEKAGNLARHVSTTHYIVLSHRGSATELFYTTTDPRPNEELRQINQGHSLHMAIFRWYVEKERENPEIRG